MRNLINLTWLHKIWQTEIDGLQCWFLIIQTEKKILKQQTNEISSENILCRINNINKEIYV